MLTIRRSADRGLTNIDWLKSRHTFSFGDYFDPAQKGFRALRVMNEDWVAPGQGFGMHPHRDMEIVTYVLDGELEHRDSMGNGAVLRAGELQQMTAGTGVMHSEFNRSPDKTVHLYQIWLFPDQRGLKPGYDQKAFPAEGANGRFRVVASPNGVNGSLTIHQDARVSLATLGEGESLRQEIALGRYAWLQILRGSVEVNGEALAAGDGAALSDETAFELKTRDAAEIMWFDLA